MQTEVKFWKEIGGHTTLAKIGNRWVYVGSDASSSIRFSRAADLVSVKLIRAPIPESLTRAYKRFGATRQTIIDHFPQWNGEFRLDKDQ